MDEYAIGVDVLPARLGDCLIVECPRPGRRPWRMVVDGGPPDAWPALQTRLDALRGDDRRVDLVVITHIDSDHIGGLIPLFREGLPGLVIDDVWFNSPPPRRSVRQGELVAALLRARRPATIGRAAVPVLPWNNRTGGALVSTAEQGRSVVVDVPDGPRLTVLSPTAKRLAFLFDKWEEAIGRAERGEPDEPDVPRPPPADLTDLAELARTRTDNDRSVANGSSIALLLEYRGATALLTGDAFPNVLGAALFGLTRSRNRETIPVDLFKLPHHASRANVTTELLALAPARHYVVSSNGDRFGHPDDVALARVALAAPPEATIWFNYANGHTMRWSDPCLESTYGYRAAFPDAAGHGLRIELPPRRVEGKP